MLVNLTLTSQVSAFL